MLHLKNGHYYTLNRVGTVAWEQFEGKPTLKEVHQVICSRFDVSEGKLPDEIADSRFACFWTPLAKLQGQGFGTPQRFLLADPIMTTAARSLVLASTSPYRKALLRRLGLAFEVIGPQTDESPLPSETAEQLVLRLAEAKARSIITCGLPGHK